jgi:hypothetical protein
MAINYTTLLGLAQPVTGTEANTWGTVVNDEITALLDSAVAGASSLDVTSGNVTLTTTAGSANQARMAILIATGTPGTTRNIVAPSQSKTYIVVNQADASVVLKGSATSGVTIRAGQAATCVWNGADFEIVASGDVDGPASATDNAITRYDGTTGKLIQNSGVTIDDSNNVSGVAQLNATTLDATNLEVTNLKAKDGTAAGSIADSTGVVTLASTVLTTTDINGGTVDGTTIGASTPSTVVATQVDIVAQGDLRLQDTTGGQYVALQAPGTLATSYTLTLPVDDGTSGQALITDGSGVLSWSSAASGDVYGPASATDNAIARYDGTTGKIIQNSAVTIADDGATVIAANSTTDGLRITQTGTGNALVVEDSANPDATPFVVDASGNVVSGNTTAIAGTASATPLNQVLGGAANTANLIGRFSANASEPSTQYLKSRSATIGSHTIVNDGDFLGTLRFAGSDGAAFIQGATISAVVDGTPGTNDMPGRLVFSTTADGASTPTERMRIGNSGIISLGAAPNAESLRVTPVASAVNYWNFNGNAATFKPFMLMNGSDTNISAVLATKGTGKFEFFTGATSGLTGTVPQFQVDHTASAVNYLQVTGAATTASPSLSAAGTDTNINLTLTPKGTGVVRDANGNIRAVPQSGSAKTTSYTLATSDVGEFIEVGSGGSVTIPDATFSAGDIVSLFNNTSGDITVTCTITTAYIAGADTNEATVTLATRGVATILFISGTVCVITGNVS